MEDFINIALNEGLPPLSEVITDLKFIATFLLAFLIVSVASHQISKLFLRFKLPLITGLIIIGVVAGPYVLDLIPKAAIPRLNFVNEIALAFIAFAAGAELYLNEMRSRLDSIKWMTASQLLVTFILSSMAVLVMADYIPFLAGMPMSDKIVVAMMVGTIFVARSPASAIAIISELRAKGPFTQTAIGVTVLKDFIVIILFAVVFSVAEAVIHGVPFDFLLIVLLVVELLLAFAGGYLLEKLLTLLLRTKLSSRIKGIATVIIGFGVFLSSHFIREMTHRYFGFEIYVEPLLICIVASLLVTNYTKLRSEFLKILEDTGPAVYVVFFTLTGAAMSLDILFDAIAITFFLFCVRVVAMIIASFIGGGLAGDPMRFNRVGWMPYVTQAGVGLGLATIVATEFPGWGEEFATVMIGVIVISQMVGPPMFKWAIQHVGEDHSKAPTHAFDGLHDAIIFGLEDQSLALARQLQRNGWNAKIATRRKNYEKEGAEDVNIVVIDDLNMEALKKLETEKAEAVITMNADGENYKICELAYEHYGTKDLIVRLNDRANFDRFLQLGCLIVEPATAMVSLMDHLVRSPQATSLLLGMDSGQDTIDIEVLNPDVHGIALRDLRLPSDVIILATKRGGQSIISTGYTRLRLHDILTVVGSRKSLETVRLKFEE